LVSTYFPCAIIIHHKRFEGFWRSKVFKKKKELHDKSNQQRPIELFFEKKYSPAIHKFRFVIIALFLGLMGVAAWTAVKIEPLTEEEQWYGPEHVITVTANLLTNAFPTSSSDSRSEVNFVWGIEGINREGTSRWDSTDLGVPLFDDKFNLASQEAQLYFIEVCDEIRTWEDVYVNEFGNRDVVCFMEDFKDWVNKNNATLGFEFPVPEEEFDSLLQEWSIIPTEKGVSYTVNQIIVFDEDKRLRIAVIQCSSESFDISVPYARLFPIYEKWEARKDEINSNAPNEEINNSFQEAGMNWVWMITQNAFVSNALSGMYTSAALCFVILVIITGNVLIASYAVFSVLGILACVMAVIHLIGFQLGTAESITTVILIGLSVDYIVHLGNHYIESPKPDRISRMTESLRDMGVSMISSGLTTIGSSVFLWGASMIFFQKFALFMTLTILFSWVWALIFFTALMFAIGPENSTGSIKALYFKLKSKLCKKQ
jgi:hypothetical protein